MFNPSFNGYLRIKALSPRDQYSYLKGIEEQKFDKNGKIIRCNIVNNLTLNTDQIISVNSRTNSPQVPPLSEIDMSNGTRYAIDIFKEDFDNKLLEAINNPNKIIDVEV